MILTYCKHISWQNYNDFVYIVNELTGQKITLDGIAKEIWLEIGAKLSLEEIENKLLNEYDVERNVIHMDLISFCEQLLEYTIIQEVC